MNPRNSLYPRDATEELSALVEVLRETEQRIEELTAGEVDSVVDRDGRMFCCGAPRPTSRLASAGVTR